MNQKLILTGCLFLFCAGLAVSQQTREIQKTFPLEKDGRVSIDTYKGSITIEPWDKNEVDVHVKIEPDGWGRDDEEKVEDTEIIFSASASSVRMKTDYDKVERHSWFGISSGNLPLVHYTVKMPRTAELTIEDYKSESVIGPLAGNVRFNTYKGEVKFSELRGGLDLETYKGQARVEYASLSAPSHFDTYKGEISLLIPQGVGCELDADIGRKADFRSDFEITSTWRVKRGDEDIRGTINGGGPRIRIKTYKGEIRLISR